MSIFSDKFKEVVAKEGVVAIVTWADNEVNVANTWNSYLRMPQDGRLLIPAAGMHAIEKNIGLNNAVKLTLGSREVQGLIGPGAGFALEGKAEFIYEGPDYDMMKAAFPFLSRGLAITVTAIKQTI